MLQRQQRKVTPDSSRWPPLAAILAALISITSGCSFFEPHKISVQQGNLVTAKSLGQLEIGMNREQVRYLLGTPLSVDAFDPDFWVYSYTLRRDTELLSRQMVRLRFSSDKLVSIETEGINVPKRQEGPGKVEGLQSVASGTAS